MDYDQNELCVWIIRTQGGKNIRIRPLENGLSEGDTLTITELYAGDGSVTTTKVVGDDQLILYGAVILVTFRSSATSTGGKGFAFEYYGFGWEDRRMLRHSFYHFNAAEGSLLYPAEGNYQPKEHVTIVIAPEGRKNPTLTIDKLDIYSFRNCGFDSLNVLNSDRNGTLVYSGKYCEPPLPAPFIAQDGLIVLIFNSDDVFGSQQTGFGISWTST